MATERYGVPTFAVAGVSTLAPIEANTAGLAGVYALSDLEPDRQRSTSRAGEVVALASERLTRELLCSGTAHDR
jgi:glycerate kinase